MASIAPDSRAFSAEPSARGPNRFWTLTEGRALAELGAFYATRPLLSSLPRGDGHSVMVMPGFMASNSSTGPMRRLLSALDYDAHGWDSGRNLRVDNALIKKLERQLDRLHNTSRGTVSLVGWSLGGVIARELAKLHPDKVRQVVSMGSPIATDHASANVRRLFEWLNGGEPEVQRDGRFIDLHEAPPVPTTSILTKSDGVVHWRGSVQGGTRADTENIVVRASHLGLGVNPSVMVALADRLAQKEGAWEPFKPTLFNRWMFPRNSVK